MANAHLVVIAQHFARRHVLARLDPAFRGQKNAIV